MTNVYFLYIPARYALKGQQKHIDLLAEDIFYARLPYISPTVLWQNEIANIFSASGTQRPNLANPFSTFQ